MHGDPLTTVPTNFIKAILGACYKPYYYPRGAVGMRFKVSMKFCTSKR